MLACTIGSHGVIDSVCAGLDSTRSKLNFRFHIMSTSRESVSASKDMSKLKNGPDHLLVLVHGILAR